MKKQTEKDLASEVRKKAGRLDTPPPIIFRDKSKYTRKQKYRRTYVNDDSRSGFFCPFKLSVRYFSRDFHQFREPSSVRFVST